MTPPPEYKTYMCLICGWLYDEASGSPEDGIAPGTRWEDVPISSMDSRFVSSPSRRFEGWPRFLLFSPAKPVAR